MLTTEVPPQVRVYGTQSNFIHSKDAAVQTWSGTWAGRVTARTGAGWLPCHSPHGIKRKNRPYALEANTLLFSVNLSPSTALDFIRLCGGGRGIFSFIKLCILNAPATNFSKPRK